MAPPPVVQPAPEPAPAPVFDNIERPFDPSLFNDPGLGGGPRGEPLPNTRGGGPGFDPFAGVTGGLGPGGYGPEGGGFNLPQGAVDEAVGTTFTPEFAVDPGLDFSGLDLSGINLGLGEGFDANGFELVQIRQHDRGFFAATRLDPTHPWAQFVGASIRETAGDLHVLPNLAGSLPNDSFTDILGLPTIWVPHSYRGCSQHAPNEHVLKPVCRDALRVMAGVFWDIGASGFRGG